MWSKILIFGGALLFLVIIWFSFQNAKELVPSALTTLFTTDSSFSIPNGFTSGLSLSDKKGVAEVSLDELGDFSPASGLVTISKRGDSLSTADINYEYIIITANADNAQPVNISNWSLQSMISDEWIGLPQGVDSYVAGEVNEVGDIYLRPGEEAIVATKKSPVGVSFRVNQCSGYLSSTQTFEPAISKQCVDPKDIVPATIENLKLYGDECVTFAQNLNRCTYVTSSTRGYDTLSPACLAYIQPRLTYNYCVEQHVHDADFYKAKEWRIFLNQDHILWRENYEVIRLLDEQFRTIDVITY